MDDVSNAPTNYNSAYTGPEIDSAVGAVLNKETGWDEAAAGKLPAGGDVGQVLEKTGAADYGAGWRTPPFQVRPNLLDNWYFVGGGSNTGVGKFPINPFAQSSYQNAGSLTISRWKLVSGSFSLAANGIVLNGTISQVLTSAVGLPVTASAITSSGTMISASYDDTTKTFSLTATGQTIAAAKLEIGTTQTLAHKSGNTWTLNARPSWEEELDKCEQHLQVITTTANCDIGIGVAFQSGSHTNICVIVQTKVRGLATSGVTLPGGNLGFSQTGVADAQYVSAENLVCYRVAAGQATVLMYDTQIPDPSVTPGSCYRIVLKAGAKIIMSDGI